LIDEAKAKISQGQKPTGITGSMVEARDISDKDVLASVGVLMSAAVDTVSL